MNINLRYRKKSNGIPILSSHEIDGFAEMILTDFNASSLKEPAPIDIEALIEFYLGLTMDYQDLTHNQSILGMTVFNDCTITVYDAENGTVKTIPVREKTVLIDNCLLEEDQEPRGRFTLGHEAGHFLLHRHLYLENKNQTSLFEVERAEPVVKCRAGDIENANRRGALYTDNDWMEWQADYMSSALLMPNPTFQIAVQKLLMWAGISEGYVTKGTSAEMDQFIEALPSELAPIFNVSIQAAKIRCDKLGVIRERAPMAHIIQ